MKGFVPVTKASLLQMVEDSREALDGQVDEETDKVFAEYLEQEKERISKRRLFGLMPPPKARFAFNLESVKEYSNNRKDYDLFDGCPFKFIERDAQNSNRWLDTLERMAQSQFAEEPILLEVVDFNRLSSPERYYWVRSDGFYYTIYR